jgi:hypothetical protein
MVAADNFNRFLLLTGACLYFKMAIYYMAKREWGDEAKCCSPSPCSSKQRGKRGCISRGAGG